MQTTGEAPGNTLFPIVLSLVAAAATGVLWAYANPIQLVPGVIQWRIFAFLPLLFTFMLAPFAAGLVIYWAWNNFLSVVQQYVIMRRQGVETQLDKLIARLTSGGAER